MKNYWATPSLSRDFALLSAAIFCILLLISFWIAYTTYTRQTEHVSLELQQEAERIEHSLAGEMDSANYMLSALGKQIVLDNGRDPVHLAQVLKSFDSKGYIYSILSWIGPDGKLLVSSNRGVLDKPVDTSDRDYVQRAMEEPWKMHIGRPIEGRVSERWIIPVAMGLTDYTGKFIGTVMLSIDINTLTEHLSSLVKRDGFSFAIVSKTLIPLTQVSDDKDFVTHNFPAQKLANVNFSDNPSGLVAVGSMFLGAGEYSYYRVSADYPYIILLSYDARYSDKTARSLLWPRLLQVLAIAVFLILLLWIMRVRMIRPILNMTEVAGSVAKGEHYLPLPVGGPVEIAGLAAQIRRIRDYIKETKRIEDELRHKMFMLKKAKEHAEVERKSQSEFLAYICQELRSPLNQIISFAQVMRDQLYGPLENAKYRQCAADIYQGGNMLLDNLQNLLTWSKMETGYVELTERSIDVAAAIQKAVRFVTDKLEAEKVRIQVKLQEPMPRLMADEARLQQILSNLILYILARTLPQHTLTLEAKIAGEHKDKAMLAILIAAQDSPIYSASEINALAERMMQAPADHDRAAHDATDLSLELARELIALHQGQLNITTNADGAMKIAVFFGTGRIRFADAQE